MLSGEENNQEPDRDGDDLIGHRRHIDRNTPHGAGDRDGWGEDAIGHCETGSEEGLREQSVKSWVTAKANHPGQEYPFEAQ